MQAFGIQHIRKKVQLFVHAIMVTIFYKRRGGVGENDDR